MKSLVKKLKKSIDEKDKNTALELMKKVQSSLAKLKKTGILAPNTQQRKTSRLAHQVANIGA